MPPCQQGVEKREGAGGRDSTEAVPRILDVQLPKYKGRKLPHQQKALCSQKFIFPTTSAGWMEGLTPPTNATFKRSKLIASAEDASQ